MLVHDGAATDPHPSYSGVRHAFRSIIKELGWKGLYQVRNFNVFFCLIKKHIPVQYLSFYFIVGSCSKHLGCWPVLGTIFLWVGYFLFYFNIYIILG